MAMIKIEQIGTTPQDTYYEVVRHLEANLDKFHLVTHATLNGENDDQEINRPRRVYHGFGSTLIVNSPFKSKENLMTITRTGP
jgi:hypothetical protein